MRENPRRDRIWELGATLHCSIIGTCLTAADLRHLFAKLGDADARTATDHVLHARAVSAAGRHGLAGKLINKALDRRHAGHVRRFAKARTADDVRRLWIEARERGEIPGGYWATLTQPATDRPLVQEVFGEVHMLSHLIGSANRADIVRLCALERAVAERDETIARQEARLRDAAAARAARAREARERRLELVPPPAPVAQDRDVAALERKLGAERARADRLAARAEELAVALKASEARTASLDALVETLGAEAQALEAALGTAHCAAGGGQNLAGRTILYVGGRPKLADQVRALAARQGGTLLTHDGGIEESSSLLPGLVSRADVALFPIDCVSHHAAEQVKRLCRQAGKPFHALRTASLASFAAAVARLDATAGPGGCC